MRLHDTKNLTVLDQFQKVYLFLLTTSFGNMEKRPEGQLRNLNFASNMKEDTTEHVLSCSKMPPHQLTQDDLYNIEDIGLWRKIIELYNCNDRLRSAVTNEKQAQEHEQNPDMREN